MSADSSEPDESPAEPAVASPATKHHATSQVYLFESTTPDPELTDTVEHSTVSQWQQQVVYNFTRPIFTGYPLEEALQAWAKQNWEQGH